MKKKRLRYSELEPVVPPAVEAVAAAPAREPATPVRRDPRTMAPLDLARAAAPARAAEAAPAVVTPGAPASVVVLPVGRSLRERARARSGSVEMLVFRVGRERFGIELAAVEEAIDIPPVHHVPEMPPAMLGVITVRGTLTSVYSPTVALGLAMEDGTSALIFRRGRSRVAVVVDEVDDVSTLDLATLRDAPTPDSGDGLLLGVVRRQESLLALVDADALLAACQAAPLLEIA